MKDFNELEQPLNKAYREKVILAARFELQKNKPKRSPLWIWAPSLAAASLVLFVMLNKPLQTIQWDSQQEIVMQQDLQEVEDAHEMDVIQNLDILEETL